MPEVARRWLMESAIGSQRKLRLRMATGYQCLRPNCSMLGTGVIIPASIPGVPADAAEESRQPLTWLRVTKSELGHDPNSARSAARKRRAGFRILS